MKLPVVSAVKLIKVLSKLGYHPHHQTGSHIILAKERPQYKIISVPKHKEIAKGTLRKILREAEIDVDGFIKLLK